MAVLLLPLMIFGYAFYLAFEGGPRRSAQGVRHPPRTARLVTLALNVIALTWYLYASARLSPSVPVGAPPGTVVYGGPGDGFALLLFVELPWLSMQLINVPLAWASSTTWRQFFMFWGLLLVCWVGAAYVGSNMMECPPEVVCVGG